jgi:hypothetical protein
MPTEVSRITKYILSPYCDVSNSILLLATAALTLHIFVYQYTCIYIFTSTRKLLIGIFLIVSRKICMYSD